jgi:hypothetical protein
MVTKSNKSRWLTRVRRTQGRSGTGTRAAGKRPNRSKSGFYDQRVLVVRIAEVHQFGISASDLEMTAETTAMANSPQ